MTLYTEWCTNGAMAYARTLTKSLRIRLTEEQLRQLQELAEREERSVGALARRAINDLLARNGKESP